MCKKWGQQSTASLCRWTAAVAVAGWLAAAAVPVQALTLEQAISIALDSNPEIGQAIENREAIEFELRQARGLYMPRVDFEASAGPRKLDSPGRRRRPFM